MLLVGIYSNVDVENKLVERKAFVNSVGSEGADLKNTCSHIVTPIPVLMQHHSLFRD